MSKLRRIKARKEKYPIWENDKKKREQFYQFALDEKKIIEIFSNENFRLIQKQHLAGIKGLKDEIKFLKKTLQKIFDSKTIIGMGVSKIISVLFNRFSSHSILLVFQNN